MTHLVWTNERIKIRFLMGPSIILSLIQTLGLNLTFQPFRNRKNYASVPSSRAYPVRFVSMTTGMLRVLGQAIAPAVIHRLEMAGQSVIGSLSLSNNAYA